jgi:hypothetical protein
MKKLFDNAGEMPQDYILVLGSASGVSEFFFYGKYRRKLNLKDWRSSTEYDQKNEVSSNKLRV